MKDDTQHKKNSQNIDMGKCWHRKIETMGKENLKIFVVQGEGEIFLRKIGKMEKEYSIKLEYANVLCTLIGIRRGFSVFSIKIGGGGGGWFGKLFSIKYLLIYSRPSSGIAMIITTTITGKGAYILMIQKTKGWVSGWFQ